MAGRLRQFARQGRDRLRLWRNRIFAFGPAELRAALGRLGVGAGDTLFVHVGLDKLAGFTGRPTEILQVLRDAVGPEGTLLMPSMPFGGSALDYIRGGPMLDVRRTPSRMGLVTELFRRSPGTLRSNHPTHPVLAAGPRAAEILADHAAAATPCGAPGPYARLAPLGARILLLGPGIETMTYYHYLEELLEPQMPFSPFTSERFTVPFRDSAGRETSATMRLFDPACSRRRHLPLLEARLRSRGAWHSVRLGLCHPILLEAAEVQAAALAMAAEGKFAYA